MAESTVRALERQLESLQKICASVEQGSFPKAMLILGKKTKKELREEIDQNLKRFGLSLEEVETLGMLDEIVICHLPWLERRGVGRGLLPMPGSE